MTSILVGRSILIIEDEPLISATIAEAFEEAGAYVLIANSIGKALKLVEHPVLSAAIVDIGLADGESTALCESLTARGIPFVIYSGYHDAHKGCESGVFIPKPAPVDVLLTTVSGLLATGSQ